MTIRKEVLDILACPKCKGDLMFDEKASQVSCMTCRLIYPIRNDIPILLIDEAIPLNA